MISGGGLLVIALMQLTLTALPGVAVVLFAIRRGICDEPVLLGVALVASGLSALGTFWGYFAGPWIGDLCAYVIFFGSIGLIVWCRPALRAQGDLLRRLRTPLVLWVLGSLFMLFFGFLHGGTENPLAMAATRFSSQLPSDNDIPQFFSNWFVLHGHQSPPPIFPPNWLASDRPPLQIGYVLAQRTFGWDTTTLHYQVVGVIAQQLWIVGLWALLVAARVGRRTRSLSIVAVLASDVAIVNGFFVWPKLLAVAFLLAAAALVVAPRGSSLRLQPSTIVLAACLASLSYLAHGSSVFGLIPLALIAVARGLPSWRWVMAGLLAGAVLIGSWSAYQHYSDPPGNRLTKWMLAGVTKVDGRSVGEAIGDAYSGAGVSGVLQNKLDNFLTMAGGGPEEEVRTREWIPFVGSRINLSNAVSAIGAGEFGFATAELRASRYFFLLPSLALFLIGLPLIAVARARSRLDGDDWRFAKFCLLFFVVSVVLWGLLLFGNVPSRTIVFTGTLALPMIGICGIIAGLGTTFPRFARWLVAANVVTTLLLYAPALSPLPGTSYSGFAIIAALAAFIAFVTIAFRRQPEPPGI